MIRLVETLPTLSGDTLPIYRIRALWECYGALPFIHFYAGEQGSAAVMFDGQVIAYATPSEREELALFIAMQPNISSVLADVDTAAQVAAHWEREVHEFPVMRYALPHTNGVSLSSVPARDLYTFLQPIFPGLAPFDVWYPDVCYRERHGFCRNVAVCETGIPISSAMTVAEWEGGALIGGVATTPAYRKRGLAGMCVSSLVATLKKEGRDVYICPKNESAQRLYTTLGFIECGRIAQVERI